MKGLKFKNKLLIKMVVNILPLELLSSINDLLRNYFFYFRLFKFTDLFKQMDEVLNFNCF